MMMKFRDHQINTNVSFNRVRVKHRDYESKMRELDARVRELEGVLEGLNHVTVKEKRRRR